jgi:hypothetical protein
MAKLNIKNIKEKLQIELKNARARQTTDDNYSFDVGYERGILRALELVGMLEKGE